MPRFTLRQWRESYEEVIIEADNLDEAQGIADNYPEDVPCAVEVVTETESTLRTEVEEMETTAWIAQFDDPNNECSAKSEPFRVEDVSDAKEWIEEWLCEISSHYEYPFDIPDSVGDWKCSCDAVTARRICTRNLENDAYLMLIEVYEP